MYQLKLWLRTSFQALLGLSLAACSTPSEQLLEAGKTCDKNQIAQLIKMSSVDLSARDWAGRSAAYLAAICEDKELVFAILKRFPEHINIVTDQGYSIAGVLLSNNNNLDYLERLTALGADYPNYTESTYGNILNLIIDSPYPESALEKVRYLMAQGVRPDHDTYTSAVRSKNLALLKQVLTDYDDVNYVVGRVGNALQFAIQYRAEDIANYLIDIGVDVTYEQRVIGPLDAYARRKGLHQVATRIEQIKNGNKQ